jgi:predicted ATPase
MPATTVRPRQGAPAAAIRTPDQRLRVFVSSTLQELAAERQAVRDAVTRLRLLPVMFELGARSHPARQVYQAYLAQSQVFIGVYWQRYGWLAPGEPVSGLEDEYLLSAGMPRLIYVKSPAPDRDPRLAQMLARIENDGAVSYQHFSSAAELQRLVENDLAVLLSERFEATQPQRLEEEEALAGPLPAPATTLVDREQETDAVVDMVGRQGVRLVALTGPGGVGKSRLAVQAAGRLSPGFRDGARFVDLAPVPDAGLVPGAIATALGLSTSGGGLRTRLRSYLRSRQILLVLDNFEQVPGAAPLIAELLSAAPGLVVLMTSRTVLRLRGEHEFPVTPLSIPPDGPVRNPARIELYGSVRLFLERARAAVPGFRLTSGNAWAVGQICRRLDGLPLAIELAAARVRLLSPRALLARLDDRLDVLTGGAPDLPERQRTLKNTLDWSFSLLSADEQVLFLRLGVFAGSFGLPEAETVSGWADGRVLDTMGSLVDSSLVRRETRDQDDEPRFRLLETVREYALERLRDSGDWADAHDRHAARFLALAQPAEAELGDPGQLAWVNRLEASHDNLRAALSWLVEAGQMGQAVQLIWVTWRFWWLRGHAEELLPYLEKIVANGDGLDPHQRAQALAGAGFTLLAEGDQAAARPLFEESLPLYRQAGDTLGAGLAAAALGRLLGSGRDGARASGLLEQTLGQLRKQDADRLDRPQRLMYLLDLALASNFLGQIRLGHGDQAGALRLFTDGLAAARRAADRFAILVSLYDLALASQAEGDLAGAARRLEEGVVLAAEAGDQSSVAYYLEALAALADRQDDAEHAVCMLSAAGALLRVGGRGWLYAYVPRGPHGSRVLAALRARTGDPVFRRAQARGKALDGSRAVQHVLRQACRDLSR